MDKLYNETHLKSETAIRELEIETDCPIKRVETVTIYHSKPCRFKGICIEAQL